MEESPGENGLDRGELHSFTAWGGDSGVLSSWRELGPGAQLSLWTGQSWLGHGHGADPLGGTSVSVEEKE